MSHSGSIVVVDNEPRESLNLRVPTDLKRRVEEYARQFGISVNAAACVLLAEALRVEQRRGK
jgi:predicted HicB family RNase H-like nuclease